MSPSFFRKVSLVVALYGITALLAIGQTGKIKFVVIPTDQYYFILDGKTRYNTNVLELTEGRHIFSFWAPERQIVDTAFTVVRDTLSVYYLTLPFSADYIKYRDEMELQEQQMRWMRLPLPIFAAGNLIYTGSRLIKMHGAHKDLKGYDALYPVTTEPAVIRDSKNKMLDLKNDLARYKRQNYISAGTLAVTAGLSYFLIKKSFRLKQPVFDDKTKVIFDGLTWIGDFHPTPALAFKVQF